MADFSLANMQRLPASIVLLGLLYSKDDGLIGQQGSALNLADLVKFPLTPIMVVFSFLHSIFYLSDASCHLISGEWNRTPAAPRGNRRR